MNRELISDTVIPARHGRAFVVSRGQVLRIYLPEGKQVGDCVFLNANDYREQFHVGQSWLINMMLGTGTATSFKHFYSKRDGSVRFHIRELMPLLIFTPSDLGAPSLVGVVSAGHAEIPADAERYP